jgi:TrpR-related protein YerC/YecD
VADKVFKRDAQTDELFRAILALESLDECYLFFEDLCTMKELADMTQRIQAARMLLRGATYEQIVKKVKISTATISRINRCILYGGGGYKTALERVRSAED